ncbi:hypothetical protein LVW23_22415 [Klebsiella pneumoniae]|nr:hypothetical protein [Klebsiella pneumoniae]
MTVSTEVDHNDYTGNGVTTSFPYTFRIFKKSDLTVQVADLNENITVLTLDTDYSVTGAGTYSGGNVVLMSPLANGWQISISRDLPVTQETDLRNQGKFFAEVHEDAFDKLTMLIQQCFSFLRLALRKPSFIANYYDALNNRIRNLRDPSQAQDAATKNYVDGQIVDNTNAWKAGDAILDQKIDTNFNKSLRVPEATVGQVPPVAQRSNSILGFNSEGNPVPIFSMTDTADLALKLSGDNGGDYVGYKNTDFNNTYSDTLFKVLKRTLNLFDFIPSSLHEGITNFTYTGDLSSYVQAAIDTANAAGGATILCPAGQYYLNVKTKQNVILIGARANTVRRAMPWSFSTSATPGSTRFRNFANDWIVASATASQTDVTSRSFGVIGIDFDAKDATNSTGGVRLRGPEFCVKSCSFYGFQDQGLEASGNIGLVEDVIANNCLLNRVRSDYVGTVEISGASDCQIHRVEGNAQVTGLSSITNASPYICGIKIAGNNHYVSALMGEISETGVYISASSVHHKMWGCRADNNVGPGYLINGVMMDTCHSYNNSRTGDGLYSGFEALPGATRIMASNCLAWTDSFPVDGTGQQRLHKYGYDFAVVDYQSLRLKPWVDQCFSYGHSLGWINSPPTYGLQYTPTIGRLSVTSDATTTPNVDGVSVIAINTTSLSQVTGLKGGMIGQQVDIYLNASATVTLVNSSSFLVNNFSDHSDKTMRVGQVYRFIKTAANIWREMGDVVRNFSGTTANRPSSAAVAGMQYFDTTLNKPIWRNAANTGWVDATGASV